MAYPRDSFRSRIYEAERVVALQNPNLTTTAQSQLFSHYVPTLTKGMWTTQSRYPRYVGTRRGRYCVGDLGRTLPTSNGGVLYVCHRALPRAMEVVHAAAHLVVPADDHHSWHSPEWCEQYLTLLRHMNPTVGDAMKRELKARKVPVKPVPPEKVAAKAAQKELKAQQALERKLTAAQEGLRRLAARAGE